MHSRTTPTVPTPIPIPNRSDGGPAWRTHDVDGPRRGIASIAAGEMLGYLTPADQAAYNRGEAEIASWAPPAAQGPPPAARSAWSIPPDLLAEQWRKKPASWRRGGI